MHPRGSEVIRRNPRRTAQCDLQERSHRGAQRNHGQRLTVRSKATMSGAAQTRWWAL